jgi:ribonucleotide monophosphatase NagD (HAD superfamily)
MFQHTGASDDLPAGLSLGVGAFVRALEAASGVQAEVVGKPTRRFFQLAIDKLSEMHKDIEEISPGDIGIVGDDMDNDLGGGALELGMKRILGMSVDSSWHWAD